MRRAGTRQRGDIPGVTPFLLIMKHTPPPLDLPASAVLSIRKTEKLSDGVQQCLEPRAWAMFQSTMMLQSLMSRWKLILALRSSILFSKDWTLASRMLGRGGTVSPLPQSVRIPALFPLCFLVPSPVGHCSPCSEEFQEATMNSGIKCPEPG